MNAEFKKTLQGIFVFSVLHPKPYTLKRGQIVIPSLLVIPSLVLFIFLIFETAKISREKIRHQFAVDSAAFIQMGDYTNLFNRTAYVNGAFPYRVFKELYNCPPQKKLQTTDDLSGVGKVCTYDMLYENGVFPKYKDDVSGDPNPQRLDDKDRWDIRFNESLRPGINRSNPEVNSLLTLITEKQGNDVWIFWVPAVGIYKLYAQIYTLLGSIENSQITVFKRLTSNFRFFRKSYYLNTGDCKGDNAQVCGETGLRSFGGFFSNELSRGSGGIEMHSIDQIRFWAKVPQSGDYPYRRGHTDPPVDIKLFQLATINVGKLSNAGKGFHVYQDWEVPSNYFNVPFNTMKEVSCETIGAPCVHARVASQCPNLSGNPNAWTGNNNCVWPSPTPKYQTRLYP